MSSSLSANKVLRKTRAVINLQALSHNLAQVCARVKPVQVMAVIKANAYGHGMAACLGALHQADAFAVATMDEALQLRSLTDKPIVLLEGFTHADELDYACRYAITCVLHHPAQTELLLRSTSWYRSKALSLWLKLDTGMHRLGFMPAQLPDLVAQLSRLADRITIQGCFSHFANADRVSSQERLVSVQFQQRQFARMLKYFHKSALNTTTWQYSLANSAAIISAPQTWLDWVRPGIMLYGVNPLVDRNAACEPALDLQAVMHVSAPVIAIRELHKGEAIGYGSDWICPQAMPVATVAIGYADGYPRHAKSGTPVSLNGVRTQLLGRVSMDMISIDLRPLQQQRQTVKIGDTVVLWGQDQHYPNMSIAVEEVARYSDTIAYELLCHMSQRVPLYY